jgi:hypothetical protein
MLRVMECALWADTSFLEGLGVMDYSLLVGRCHSYSTSTGSFRCLSVTVAHTLVAAACSCIWQQHNPVLCRPSCRGQHRLRYAGCNITALPLLTGVYTQGLHDTVKLASGK